MYIYTYIYLYIHIYLYTHEGSVWGDTVGEARLFFTSSAVPARATLHKLTKSEVDKIPHRCIS